MTSCPFKSAMFSTSNCRRQSYAPFTKTSYWRQGKGQERWRGSKRRGLGSALKIKLFFGFISALFFRGDFLNGYLAREQIVSLVKVVELRIFTFANPAGVHLEDASAVPPPPPWHWRSRYCLSEELAVFGLRGEEGGWVRRVVE